MSVASKDSIAPPLPHNLEAERAVLGAVILDNHTLAAARARLGATDFFLPQHRIIFARMVELAGKQQPIDTITLMEELQRGEELESAGGIAYLSQLTDGLPRLTNVDHYAGIVKQKALLRSAIYLGDSIRERAFAGEIPAEDAIERLRSLRADEGQGWRDVFHTFDEFEAAKPLTFAIEGFLQNNAATMFGGLSGDSKTWMMLSTGKALLRGEGRLWDLFDVKETAERIIYLIPECSIEPFKHRLKLFGIYPYLAPDNERLLVRTLSKGPTPRLSDPRILSAAKNAHVFLDTAIRFGNGDENDADANRALANDIFTLLGAGARSVVAAHHSPKPFAKENVMRLENVLRGSGDIGAMVATAWGIKQLDAEQNIVHVENIKARDFQPCGAFQIIGRPFIDNEGNFRLHKRPGDCGSLQDEQPAENRGGAPQAAREAKAANKELLVGWLRENPNQTGAQLAERFQLAGVSIDSSTVRHYLSDLKKAGRL